MDKIKDSNIKKALILAGGSGTRFKPVTDYIPKPMIPFYDKPIIEHVADELVRNGIDDIAVSVGYKANVIMHYLSRYDKAEMSFIKENEPLGTGGAIKLGINNIFGRSSDEDIIIANGDNVFNIDLRTAYSMHKKENALVTIGLHKVEDVSGFGVVETNGNRIIRFIEKPDPSSVSSNMINMGIYIFNRRILGLLPKENKFSMERDFFEKKVDEEVFCGHISDMKWSPLDSPERYNKALEEWRETLEGTSDK